MSEIETFLKENFSKEKNILDSVSEIFNSVSLEIQKKKAKQHCLPEDDANLIIENLKVRPSLLVEIANRFNCKKIAEVGTAQGLQSISFAECVENSKVYTCDIVDDRKELFNKYENLHFINGNSKEMFKEISKQNDSIDLFWVDGAHDHYSVLSDFVNLLKVSHKNTIWVFDDFDDRFGCFYDIQVLMDASKESFIVDLGKTASGNPNKIVICKGLK